MLSVTIHIYNVLDYADKPDAPGKPEVKDSDRSFIKIGWTKPKSDGGSPITGYHVERKNPKTGKFERINLKPIPPKVMATACFEIFLGPHTCTFHCECL